MVLTPLTVTPMYINLSIFKCDIVITSPTIGLLLLPSGRNNDLSVLPSIVLFGIHHAHHTIAHHAITSDRLNSVTSIVTVAFIGIPIWS